MTRQNRTVVIIGAARSGTKLLRDLIALHPDVARVPYDVNYVWRIGNQRVPHDELEPGLANEGVRRRIVAKLESFREGRPILIEKTVSNCVRVPFVRQVLPEAQFIHLFRDGRDVVESVHRQWLAPPDWKALARKLRTFPLADALRYSLRYAGNTGRRLLAGGGRPGGVWGVHYRGIERDLERFDLLHVIALQWTRCVSLARRELARLPGGVCTVRYEDLVEDPARELGRIAGFLGLDVTTFKEADLRWVRVDAVGKGLQALPGEFDRLLPLLRDELVALGYL